MNRPRIDDVVERLLEYVENNRTFQGDKIATVPPASYTDPGRWRVEMEVIFKRVPLMLALTCELPNPGDYKAMEAVGMPILITRDKMGLVRAFLNVCAHRWAPVTPEGLGNCLRFTCPFHGWTYGADGRLIGISDPAKFGDVDKSAHGLKPLPCEERHGAIFVCLTPGMTLDLDSYYGEMLDACAHAGMKDWVFLGSRVVEGANWKVAFDTFLEAYHFATLHAKSLESFQVVNNTVHFDSVCGPHFRNGYPMRSIRKLRELPRAQWPEHQDECFSFLWIFFPNIVVNFRFSAEAITLVNQILPGPTPDRSRNVMLFTRKHPPKDEADRKNVEKQIDWLYEIVRDEDYAISLQIQKGLRSGAHEGVVFGRNERGNQYFHEWVNWYLKGDGNVPKPTM